MAKFFEIIRSEEIGLAPWSVSPSEYNRENWLDKNISRGQMHYK